MFVLKHLHNVLKITIVCWDKFVKTVNVSLDVVWTIIALKIQLVSMENVKILVRYQIVVVKMQIVNHLITDRDVNVQQISEEIHLFYVKEVIN